MHAEFFGNDSQLFGIYHPPRGNPGLPVRAVLICPPFGQEFIRTHWCLRLLAGQLARKGLHVLRFDYFGIGDSMGSPVDVQRLNRWEQDIESAMDHLLAKSGADSCALIGLRTGAALATRVATQRSDANSLVLWEPVQSGRDWLTSARQMHQEMLDLWVCKMQTADNEQQEELLGTLYSRQLMDDLETTFIDWQSLQLPQLVVDVEPSSPSYDAAGNSMRKLVFTEDEYTWDDLNQLETAWLRPQTTRTIVEHVSDLFERLIRFGILAPTEEVLL